MMRGIATRVVVFGCDGLFFWIVWLHNLEVMKTTNRLALRGLWIPLLLSCLAVPFSSPPQVEANRQQIVSQARKALYNLRQQGLIGFECAVTPNWDALLADEHKTNPEGADTAVKTLNQLHFVATLGADGKLKLRHNELTAQSQQMMDSLRQIYGGMEQMTSGFFDTWSFFIINSPFPEANSEYKLEDAGPQYLLTYRDGPADVATDLRKDFAISNLKVTRPSSIAPSVQSSATVRKACCSMRTTPATELGIPGKQPSSKW
jgi:hypothetical protein